VRPIWFPGVPEGWCPAFKEGRSEGPAKGEARRALGMQPAREESGKRCLITLARSLDQARAILNPHQAAAVRDESTFLQSTGRDADGTCSRANLDGRSAFEIHDHRANACFQEVNAIDSLAGLMQGLVLRQIDGDEMRDNLLD
jgi:hypothetical protein